MRHTTKAELIFLLTMMLVQPGYTQQPAPAHPVALDPAALRRDAARLAEVRGLLADPDPNVRLLAMREIMKSGDPVQRQLAVEAGLSSADAAMVEAALRAVMANVSEVVITLTDMEGKPVTKSDYNMSSTVLTIISFDQDTGRFTGPNLTGQLQGNVFSFRYANQSGILVWDPDAGEFRGTINLYGQRIDANRKGAWRLR